MSLFVFDKDFVVNAVIGKSAMHINKPSVQALLSIQNPTLDCTANIYIAVIHLKEKALLQVLPSASRPYSPNRPPIGMGATGAKAPVNFEQQVPGTRPETECTYHKFSNEGYNCL